MNKTIHNWMSKPHLLVLPVAALFVVWGCHVVLTQIGGPLVRVFDPLLYLVAFLLKLPTLVALCALLGAVYQTLHRVPKSAPYLVLVWLVLTFVIIRLLAFFRNQIAASFSGVTVKYFSVLGQGMSTNSPYEKQLEQAWLPQWFSGQIFWTEFGLAVALVVVHCLIGLAWGSRTRTAVGIGVTSTFALLIFHQWLFGLVQFDYDFFHGDIFSGGLLMDMILPVAEDPYTTIGCLVYLPFALSSILFLALIRRKTKSEE